MRLVIITILLAIMMLVSYENYSLHRRNLYLEATVRKVVYNQQHHCLGYVEPGKVIKDLYIKHLLNKK